MQSIRPLNLPLDIGEVLALDLSFETDRIYRAEMTDSSFRLVETTAYYSKRYSLDIEELSRLSALHYAVAASIDGIIVGLAAAEFADWNRRVILHHLYVGKGFRHSGVGQILLQNADAWARTNAARCIWLETQNVNFPAIQFYRRAGFSLCGFDASLYDAEHEGTEEVGLFFSKSLA